MGIQHIVKVLRRGAEGQPCLPIIDPSGKRQRDGQLVARLVLLELAERANIDDKAWPSVATIGLETGLSRRSVQRGLLILQESGLIEIIGNPNGGATSRRYLLKLDEAIEREVEKAKRSEGRQIDTGVTNGQRGVRNRQRGVTSGQRGVTNGQTGDQLTPEPLEPPTNTSGTTMNGGGGGGEDGERRSAPRQGSERRSPHLTEGEKIDAYEDFLPRVEERAKAEGIDVTFDRSNKAGRDLLEKRLHAGWKPDRLVERLFEEKWAKPKSPNGFLISRLKQLPEAPDYYEKRDAKKKQKETEELTRLGIILDEITFDKSFGVSTWYRHFGENSTVLRGIEDEFGSYRSAPAQEHARKNAKLATTVLANLIEQLIEELSSSLKADLEWFLDVHPIGETPNSGNLADDLEQSINRYRRLKEASEECAPDFGWKHCQHQKEES